MALVGGVCRQTGKKTSRTKRHEEIKIYYIRIISIIYPIYNYITNVFTLVKFWILKSSAPCGRFCNAAGHVPQVPSPDRCRGQKTKEGRAIL